MVKYDESTKEKIKVLVSKKTQGHGGEYFTPYPVIEDMLDQFPSKKGSWAVLFNLEILFSLIFYKKVDPKNITFFEDCPIKKKIAN